MSNLYFSLVKFIRRIEWLRKLIWNFRVAFHSVRRLIFIRKFVVDGHGKLTTLLEGATPFAAGKLGATEAGAVYAYLKRKKPEASGNKPQDYPPYLFHTLFVNSGVFPQKNENFDCFCDEYIQAAASCDALVSWGVKGELEIYQKFCSDDVTLLSLRSLEPYFSSSPWSLALAGKNVLVISPFTDSIVKQFPYRNEIWGDKQVLPDFNLLTLKAPMSAGLRTPTDESWFAALERMKASMDKLDYDVALIGAGAFSLPLAVYAKQCGKAGIHLGGALQILFGIIGKRWREHPDFKGFINEYWFPPSQEERPENYKDNEGGCYW